MLVSLLVIGGFTGFVNFRGRNARGTFVEGSITIDTIWDLAGSPYVVIDDVTVISGVTLTIEPGVEIRFDGYYSIYIDGTLLAIGTEFNRIIITSNMVSPAPSDWRNIAIYGYGEIKYCDITYGWHGIYLSDSSNNTISNDKISNNAMGIYLFPSSNNTISSNNITNNSCAIMMVKSSRNNITNNDISNNDQGLYILDSFCTTITKNNFSNDGIFIQGDRIAHFNSHNISTDNLINGKPLYHYKNCSGINIDNIPVGELILTNCTDIDVKNLHIDDTDFGIEIAFSNNISITNNNITSTYVGGIYLYSSSNNKILTNNISNAFWGIDLKVSSNNNTIANNNISLNENVAIGIGLSFDNVIANNNISNNEVAINIGTIWLDSSSNNTITGNNFSENMYAIIVHRTSENEISWNNLSDNEYGIRFKSAPRHSIIGNSIYSGGYGLYFIESSNENVITGNTILKNREGIHFESSSNNRIYHNNIINNSIQAFDDRDDNLWNNSYPSGGNYWSDFNEPSEGAYDNFKGQDQNVSGGDGIVDLGPPSGGINPYVIDSDSKDHYPLIDFEGNYLFLFEGWNLISLPFIQADADLETVLQSIEGSYDTVEWYDIGDSSDHWKVYNTGKPYGNDLSMINETMGFWINISEPGGVLFEYFGIKPSIIQKITLYPGWNLVGYPSLSNKNRTAALNNIDFGTDVDSIWSYNAVLQEWEEIGELDYFKVGRGYWIYSKVEKVWDVPL